MDDREKIREAINRLENLLPEDEWGDVSFELDRLYAALAGCGA